MTRLVDLAASALLLASCTQVPSATRTAPARAPLPPLHVATQAEPLRGYRLAESFVAKGPFRDGAPLRIGAIVDGLRVRPDATGLRLAESVAVPALQGGVPLPDALGGGFMFWNDSALYTADSFLGTLDPLFDVGFRPVAASFGPSFALLRGLNGERLAIDVRTRQRVPIEPPFLADIAVTVRGRALALLEGGSCSTSEDDGKTYRPMVLPPGTHALSVRETSGELIARLDLDQQIRIDLTGRRWLEAAAPVPSPRSTPDSLWPIAESPLERALAFGVPIGREFAGVAVAGAVATVNLRTGELVQVTRALVPSDLSCRTLDANGSLILVCFSPKHGSVVLSDVFGEHPQTQAKFASGVQLGFSAGILVAAARCDGAVHPGAVCVRSVDGRFHDFDVSDRMAKLGRPAPQQPAAAGGAVAEPSIVRWIPKVGGGAVALVDGPAAGLLDAQSGDFVALSPEVVGFASEATPGSESRLGLDWIALPDGSVRGWLSNRALAIAKDGRLEPSVYEFRNLSGAGEHALACDAGQRVFQSLDWGRTWVETLAPPVFTPGSYESFAPHCSLVGCTLGPWLRVGWAPEVPAARLRRQIVAKPPTRALSNALPILSCAQLSSPSMAEQPPPAIESDARYVFGVSRSSLARDDQDYQATFSWNTVHPLQGAGESRGLRASFAIRAEGESAQGAPPANSATARISFVSAFDPSARVRASSISWRALDGAARATGAAPLSFRLMQEELTALPVLGRAAGESEGLLLAADVPIWVRGPGSALALSSASAPDEIVWVSAVQRAQNQLVLLGVHPDGKLDVVEFAAGRARRLFQLPGLEAGLYPSNPDALAVGPQGALAVLRAPSGSEPATSSDPMFLLHEDGNVSALAPWSRLFLADAPECKPAANDYRAVLQTGRTWLRLIDAAEPMTREAQGAGMFALLRGNADRLCLEAVELAEGSLDRQDSSYETRLSARFVGREQGAARLGFAAGFEFRQGLNCRLSAAR